MDAALENVRAAIRLQPNWEQMLGGLSPALVPAAAAVLERLRQSG
jgi:hypothetical protein